MKRNGYTLVELAVVVFLAGLMLTLAVPKVRDTLVNDGLKSTVRHFVGAVRALRTDAVREQIDYVLLLDLDKNSFWTYSTDMTPEKLLDRKKNAFLFPAGVKIADVSQLGLEKKSGGEVAIKLYKQGYVQPTIIHLVKDDRYLTIALAPFLNNIKIYEKYAELTPEGAGNLQ